MEKIDNTGYSTRSAPLDRWYPFGWGNMIPANKNISTTHIKTRCDQLHPVEWNIGESGGMLEVFCLNYQLKPRQIRNQHKNLQSFQQLLRSHGVGWSGRKSLRFKAAIVSLLV